MDSTAKSNFVVQRITRNVIRHYIGLEAENASQRDDVLPETTHATNEAALQTDAS
jgi:hypothetical protein